MKGSFEFYYSQIKTFYWKQRYKWRTALLTGRSMNERSLYVDPKTQLLLFNRSFHFFLSLSLIPSQAGRIFRRPHFAEKCASSFLSSMKLFQMSWRSFAVYACVRTERERKINPFLLCVLWTVRLFLKKRPWFTLFLL